MPDNNKGNVVALKVKEMLQNKYRLIKYRLNIYYLAFRF